jgi:hypothetical protein
MLLIAPYVQLKAATHSNPLVRKITIYFKDTICGYIDYLFDENEKVLSVLYVFIQPEFQGKKIGSYALKLLIKDTQPVKLYADVISSQSFKCFVRAFDRFPDFCCSFCNFKFECLIDVLNFLVPYVETCPNGEIVTHKHGGVHIIYNI